MKFKFQPSLILNLQRSENNDFEFVPHGTCEYIRIHFEVDTTGETVFRLGSSGSTLSPDSLSLYLRNLC